MTGSGWLQHAACRGEDPELFFPVGTEGPAVAQIAEAKRVCSICPARRECLDVALLTGQGHGIWGGLSEDERRLLPARTAVVATGAPDLCMSGRHVKSGPGRCSECRKEFERKREATRERDQAAVYARRVARRMELERSAA